MRKIMKAMILASGITAISLSAVVGISHYREMTSAETAWASDVTVQASALSARSNVQLLEQTEQAAAELGASSLYHSTIEVKAEYEDLLGQLEALDQKIYIEMAAHDPMRFQVRRAECWIRNEKSTRCTAIAKITS